jgi:hypothetical protein
LEREIFETRERLAALTAQAAKLRARIDKGQRGPAAAASFDEPGVRGRKRRRRMSADARKRLSESTRKRWAERKKKGLKSL